MTGAVETLDVHGRPAGVRAWMRPGRRWRQPGIEVTLSTHAPTRRVTVGVGGGVAPIRLYLYLDGDLVDAWSPGEPEPSLDAVPGRHVLTARAIDATGRWGGASDVVEFGVR